MSIRAPSKTLAAPNITVLAAGTRLHRAHDRNFAANAFNPCQGGATRFAPISDASGTCIGSLYGGSTLEAAIYETIFHDVPAKAKIKTVPKANVHARAHGELESVNDLNLATLRAADLKQWRISRTALIASSPKLYHQTAQWALAIHDQFADVHGLVWTSNQCDPDDAYLFFGDRVAATDFTIITTRDGLTDTSFLADVRAAGRRGGIVITV
jgi:hypothetical protein